MTREAVIVDAVRTPVGKRGGQLRDWHPVDLLAHTLTHLVDRTGVAPDSLADVIVGCALQRGEQTGNVARTALLGAGLPIGLPGTTLDRQCGSGQQSVHFAAQGVRSGEYDVAIGAGVESMSRVDLGPLFDPSGPRGEWYGERALARFEALEKLHAFCEKEGLRTHFHLKCSPAVKLMLKRRGKSLPGITGESMPFEGIIDLIERSRGTFDFANHAQSGYTMRLIENMAAGVKVVTEKTRIETEDFYRDDRFLAIRDHDLSAVPEFLARPITSQLDVEQFSVDNWVRQLVQPQETGA